MAHMFHKIIIHRVGCPRPIPQKINKCTLESRKSVSTSAPRRPRKASMAARTGIKLDFPMPCRNEWIVAIRSMINLWPVSFAICFILYLGLAAYRIVGAVDAAWSGKGAQFGHWPREFFG